MTETVLPLKELLEKKARLQKPATAAVPSKFAIVTPKDLFDTFEVTGLDYKGQFSSGYSEVGWSIEVGMKDFDFSVIFTWMPDKMSMGSLTPEFTYIWANPKSAMIILQKLPQQISFPGLGGAGNQPAATAETGQADAQEDQQPAGNGAAPDNGLSWHCSPQGKVAFLTMNGRILKQTIEIGIDVQVGWNPSPGFNNPLSGKPTAFENSDGETYKAYGEDNSISLGVDLQLAGKKQWTTMLVTESAPGYYPKPGDGNLNKDFSKLVADVESDRLIPEIFKWLTHTTTGKSGLTKKQQQLSDDARKKIIMFGMPGVVIKEVINKTLAMTKFVGLFPNVQRSLRGIKNYVEKGGGQKNIAEIATGLDGYAGNLRQNRAKLAGEFEEALKPKLKKLAPKDLGVRLALQRVLNSPSLLLWASGMEDNNKLREVITSNQIVDGDADKITPDVFSQVSGLLKKTADSNPKIKEQRKELAAINIIVERADNYVRRLDALGAQQEKKAESVGPSTHAADAKAGGPTMVAALQKMTFVKMATSLLALEPKVGASVVVPLFAQTLAAAGADASLNIGNLLEVFPGHRHTSRYRYQSIAFSQNRNKGALIQTQDTDLVYSQAVLQGSVAINAAAFSGVAQLDIQKMSKKTKLTKKLFEAALKKIDAGGAAKDALFNTFNAINYRSAIGYWRYPSGDNEQSVRLGRSSGLNFGCTAPIKMLVRLAKEPNSLISKRFLKTLAAYLAITPDELAIFLKLSGITELDVSKLPDAFLLETGFSFDDKLLQRAKFDLLKEGEDPSAPYQIQNIFQHRDVREFMSRIQSRRKSSAQAEPIQPDTIRLRFRIADALDNSQTKFKLGILLYVPFLIELQPIEKAGQEGIIDFFTVFVKHGQFNVIDGPAGVQNLVHGYEESVPSVVLLHQ